MLVMALENPLGFLSLKGVPTWALFSFISNFYVLTLQREEGREKHQFAAPLTRAFPVRAQNPQPWHVGTTPPSQGHLGVINAKFNLLFPDRLPRLSVSEDFFGRSRGGRAAGSSAPTSPRRCGLSQAWRVFIQSHLCIFDPHQRTLFSFAFREEGLERNMDIREKHQWVAVHIHPDEESNLQPFTYRVMLPTT